MLNLLGSSGKRVFTELIFDGFPKLEFGVECKNQDFDLTNFVDISFDEFYRYGTQICQMHGVIGVSSGLFTVEFEVDGNEYDPSKKTAFIFLITVPIGSHIFGMILVLTSSVEEIEDDRFRLISLSRS